MPPPDPTPTPVPASPGPTPTPVPASGGPGPTPVPVTPAPTPTPVPATPGPTPTPVPASFAPTPTPVPATPVPTPTPVPASPGPTPTPVPASTNPTPTPVPATPGPTPTPVPASSGGGDQLQSAGSDADANAGSGNVGDAGSSCSKPEPAELSVVIKKSDGTPVEGASVSVTELGQSGTTGADGVADFGEVPAGSYTAVGQKDNFAPPSSGDTTAPATQTQAAPASTSTQIALVLDPIVATIAVHVQTSAGAPVEGVTVSVDGKGWDGVTDASGNFSFGEVPPDTYTMSGEKTSFSSATQTQAAPARAATQYNLVMDACSITSVAVAVSPANRARTRVGVGEEVDLTVSPTAATWAITSGTGTLTPNSGSQTTVRFTAGDTAGDVTITATAGACVSTITFTVVEPANWTQQRTSGVMHSAGRPDCGWRGKWYVHPNDVNFYNMNFREKDSQAVTTGSYAPFSGVWHGNYPPPDQASSWFALTTHSETDGSGVAATDTVYSGDPGTVQTGTAPPFTTGTMYFPITMQWKVGSGAAKNFSVANQEHEIFAPGKCESRKGGNTEKTMYNDAASGY